MSGVHIHDACCDSLGRTCPVDPTYRKKGKLCGARNGPTFGLGNEHATPISCARLPHTSGDHEGYGNGFRILRWQA